MKIYTRTGDKGQTGLWGGERVPKYHPRVAAYGDVDELNSCLGASMAALGEGKPFSELRRSLARIQEELFIIGALLATPEERLGKLSPPFDQGLPPEAWSRLEAEIDRLGSELSPMTKFILPGGSTAGAWLHLARTLCRRTERGATWLATQEKIPETILVYLNRLSDYLFTAARWVNAKAGSPETQWQGLAKR